jgi:hypothetical protein
MLKALILVTLCSVSTHALADWAEAAGEYNCDRAHAILSLRSTVTTSQPDAGEVKHRADYDGMEDGQPIACNIGGVPIKIGVRVTPPHDQGVCAGTTHTDLGPILVGRKKFVEIRTPFVNACDDEVLYLVDFSASGHQTVVHMCWATWDWGTGFKETRCKDELV